MKSHINFITRNLGNAEWHKIPSKKYSSDCNKTALETDLLVHQSFQKALITYQLQM